MTLLEDDFSAQLPDLTSVKGSLADQPLHGAGVESVKASLPGRETIHDWLRYAACHGMTDLFFPERGEDYRLAIAVCTTCPVISECYELAMELPYAYPGIYAGLSQRDRRNAKARREGQFNGVRRVAPRAGCGSDSGYYRHRSRGEQTCQACRDAHTEAEIRRQRRRGVPVRIIPGYRNRRYRERYLTRIEAGWCPQCAKSNHGRCKGDCVCEVCEVCA